MPYLQRLNHQQPIQPTDPFYIKHQPELLTKCLQPRSRVFKQILERVTPQVNMRFKLFPIQRSDLNKFEPVIETLEPSSCDPFMSQQHYKYEPLHKCFKQTNADIIDLLEQRKPQLSLETQN